MKKLAILACVMTVSTGLSMAQSTIAIPFFGDNAGGLTAFIGLQNVGPGSIVITANYLDFNGANGASGGTFTLIPGQSASFRPNSTLGGEVQPAGLLDAPASYLGFGSMTFDIPAGGIVSGRYVQWGGAPGSFAHNLQIN